MVPAIKWVTCQTGTNTHKMDQITNGRQLAQNTTQTIIPAESTAGTPETETIEMQWDIGQMKTKICSFPTRARG